MTAARLGISEAEFWQMLPRELDRRARAHAEREEQRHRERDADFFNRLNATGFAVHQAINLAFAGKAWKWHEPPERPADKSGRSQEAIDLERRERAVLKRLEERKRRKKAQTVTTDG